MTQVFSQSTVQYSMLTFNNHFHILNFNLNFFFWRSVRQSMNKSAQIRIIPTTKLAIDFHDNAPSIILSACSDAYFPICTVMASLVNLPTKKAGIIYKGFIFAIPAARISVLLEAAIKSRL